MNNARYGVRASVLKITGLWDKVRERLNLPEDYPNSKFVQVTVEEWAELNLEIASTPEPNSE